MEEFRGLPFASFGDDDEEEGGEEIGYAYLGFLEKPDDSASLLRHSLPSKAGGFPAWLDPLNLPSGESSRCDLCGEPLKFLLQVYSPDEMAHTFHRTLFVFICPSLSCLRDDQRGQRMHHPQRPCRSVKVFRCQLTQINPFYPPVNDGRPSTTVGAELCTWCGTWKGINRCRSCRAAIYCSEKHRVKHSKEGHDYDCQRAQTAHRNDIVPVELPKAACPTIWPAFKIIEEHEEDFGAQMPLTREFQGGDDKKSWASFQRRISWAPDQVLRYCRDPNAKPLWPKASGRPNGDDIPPCRHCGGPLCFEFQILPQLLYYLQVGNYVDSIDWATIAVYTCEASCHANLVYKEEYAWVQLGN